MQDIRHQGGEHAVLLIHGLSGNPLEMSYLAKVLHRAGFSVFAPHLDGYGFGGDAAPAGKMGVRSESWEAQALMHFDTLRRDFSTVSVAGLCIGANIALRIAAARQGQVTALSLLATTLYYDGWALPWTRHLLPIAYYTPLRYLISFREREPFGVKNPRLREWIAREMRESGTSIAGAAKLRMTAIYEAQRLIRATKRCLAQVTAPALIMHAMEDDVTSARSADFVERHIASRVIRKELLKDCYHIITLDNEKDVVAAETSGFFLEQIARDGQVHADAEVMPFVPRKLVGRHG